MSNSDSLHICCFMAACSMKQAMAFHGFHLQCSLFMLTRCLGMILAEHLYM